MWPEGSSVYLGPSWREPTRAEIEKDIAEARDAYRESIRLANKQHAQNVARIRKHRDDMLALFKKRLDAATI